jgi:hypothetical protein
MRPKIEIGTTYPYSYQGRFVNAEVVSFHKIGKRKWCTVRLTESQRPIVRDSGSLAGTTVEFQVPTSSVAGVIKSIGRRPVFGPARPEQHAHEGVVQWIDFGPSGLWCEIREPFTYCEGRNTHWTKSEYKTVEELIASGDANPVGAAT